jgi:hypothetical protein
MEAFAPLRYLIRPLQLEAALLILTFSVLLALASYAGLFGLPLGFIITSWFLKYAFLLLDHIADGKPGGPVLSTEMANPLGEARPWLYLALLVSGFIATEILRPTLGSMGASSLRILSISVLPAMIAVHSATGSFIAALNPVAVGTMIWRMRWGYVCVLMVAITCFLALQFIAIPPLSTEDRLVQVLRLQFMPNFLRTMALMYLWLAMFAVLGGALFEYRNVVGFEASHSPERLQAREDAERDRLRAKFIDRIFGEYRSGAYINAWNSIQEYVRNSTDALDDYRWIYQHIAAWPSSRLANRLLQEMLPLLLNAQSNGEALRLIKSRILVDAEFRPATSEQLIKLAHLARDGGDRPLARTLLQDFERHFPNDAARNSAVQLAGQLTRL